MHNVGHVIATVQGNCHISDAQYAGDYTLCIFLLKMREFYRWENQIPFSGALPREAVGKWMQEREQLWERVENMAFEPLNLGSGSLDPFDADSINRTLVPQGYVYSAGYGRFGKPHFFLGALQRQEKRDGYTVYVSTCEYARDLVSPPAMMQNGTIYLRQESLRRYLWERIEEWRLNSNTEAVTRALSYYDFDHDMDSSLDHMTEVETESAVLHEIGEALAGEHLGEAWHALLADLSRTKGEIMARAVRDILADCLSTLPRLIEQDNNPALHFYFASFSGMRRYLFPEAMTAYRHWADSSDIDTLHQLVLDGARRWLDIANRMLALHRQFGSESGAAIETLLEHPFACQIQTAH
jgi:hypothetical protein